MKAGEVLICPACGRRHVVTHAQASNNGTKRVLTILCDGTYPDRHAPVKVEPLQSVTKNTLDKLATR